jgi:DNA-binding NarL/FixJ family response regulator
MAELSIVVADDSALLREGIAGLLERRGHKVIGQASSAPELIEVVKEQVPDVVITDVRMPPSMSDDGLQAAVTLRETYPNLAVMVVSQYVARVYASELFADATGGTGYLLKDRISEVASFLDSLAIVASVGTVIDPTVASTLMSTSRSGLATLTPREQEVLELMSQGMSNKDIAARLVLSSAAVAKHVSNIFMKLGLDASEDNRRVKAILEYLATQNLK